MRYILLLCLTVSIAIATKAQQRSIITGYAVTLKVKPFTTAEIAPPGRQNKTADIVPIPVVNQNTLPTPQPGFYTATPNPAAVTETGSNKVVGQLKPSGNSSSGEGLKELLSHPVRINLGNASVFVSKRGLGVKFYIFRPFR